MRSDEKKNKKNLLDKLRIENIINYNKTIKYETLDDNISEKKYTNIDPYDKLANIHSLKEGYKNNAQELIDGANIRSTEYLPAKLDSNSDDAQRIDVEPELSAVEKHIQSIKNEHERKRIEFVVSALEKMKDQFANSEKYVRELIQNSIDASATSINVKYDYNKEKKRGYISVEDNGIGMNESVIRKELLTLFESRKENDITKIGRFGVGFVSVFAQDNLESVIVNTNDGIDDYIVKLLPPSHGWKGAIFKATSNDNSGTEKKKGTKVTLEVAVDEQLFEKYKLKLTKELDESCAYVQIPILVDGKSINKELSIPNAQFQIRFGGGNEIEGVMGYAYSGFYSFFNRRLLISHENSPLFKEDSKLCVMISSPSIDYNISRDAVLENKRFKQILQLLKDKKKHLIASMISELAENPQYTLKIDKQFQVLDFTGNDFVFRTLDNYIEELLSSRKETSSNPFKDAYNSIKGVFVKKRSDSMTKFIPREIRQAKIITGMTYDNERVGFKKYSMDEVIGQAMEEKGILSVSPTLIDFKLDKVSVELLKRGKILLPHIPKDYHKMGEFYEDKDPQERLLKRFVEYMSTYSKYSVPSYEDESSFDEYEKNFLNTFRSIVNESPLGKYIGIVAMTPLDSRLEKAYVLNNDYSSGYGKQLFKAERTRMQAMKDTLFNKKTLTLNRSSQFMKDAIEIANGGSQAHLAYAGLLSSLSFELKHEQPKLPLMIEGYINQKFSGEQK